MSEFIVRGEATPAQRHLDGALAAWRGAGGGGGGGGGRGGLGGLLLHSMRDHPDRICTINGATNKTYTNAEMVSRASRVSRAMSRLRGGGERVRAVVMLKNHEDLLAVYYGVLAAGALPLMLDAEVTALELKLFLELLKPDVIFCEGRYYSEAQAALLATGQSARVVVADPCGGEAGAAPAGGAWTTLKEFTAGCSGEWADDVLADVKLEDTVLMVPTSGSTGLPKGVLLTHEGLIAHLPVLWVNHSKFPQPEESILLVSTAQWLTHSLILTSVPVFQVPVVTTPRRLAPDHVLDVIEAQRPSWLLMSPPLAGALASALAASPRTLSPLRTLLLTGSPPPAEVVQILKNNVEKGGLVLNGYGMSEAQGFVAIPRPDTPPGSIGQIINIVHYKIVDETGKECGPNEPGELQLKSDRVVFKGYYNNPAAFAEAVSDGWYRTGDKVRADDQGNIFYVQRLKFIFKHNNFQISPEEVESVVNSVPGVEQSAVGSSARGLGAAALVVPGVEQSAVGSSARGLGAAALVVPGVEQSAVGSSARGRGAAALVVPRAAGATPEARRELEARIHAAVNAVLSDYKRLRGGIAFVPELPKTRSGKLQRRECQELMDTLL